MKVERVSYDVITPSAGRAIFEAILWKPAILWEVKKIEILAPIRWASVRRNEVGKVASERSSGIFIEEDRQQRASLLLRDVRYRLTAEFVFIPPAERPKIVRPLPDWLEDPEDREVAAIPDARADEKEAKYAAMFERRAKRGQTFHQPYFGCREFPVDFKLIRDPENEPPEAKTPEEQKALEDAKKEFAGERDFGWSLFDMNYSDPNDVQPMFYRPKAIDGVIDVDKYRREAGIPDARVYQVARKEAK